MRELAIDLRTSIQSRVAQASRLTSSYSIVMSGCLVIGYVLGRVIGGDLLVDAAIASIAGLVCFFVSEAIAVRESSQRFGQQRNVQEMRLSEQTRILAALCDRDLARAG